ncbi:MAG: hypothetical protein ABIT96_11255, partial [Ferruginibacter sp.]
FKRFSGKIIRSISADPMNFGRGDAFEDSRNFGSRVAHKLHKTSTQHLILNNLFFKEGQKLSPLLLADNERFLRQQPFLQDAMIIVRTSPGNPEMVDVIVITKDVFSIGGSVSGSSSRVQAEIREENLYGYGNRLSIRGLLDKDRNPKGGFGGEFLKRNINGSFVNWATGFNTFNSSFNTGRREENSVYTIIERPLISRYMALTGALEFAYNRTYNAYSDSLYYSDARYGYIRADGWVGYNFGYKSGRTKDSEQRLRHFFAVRKLYNHFYKVPGKFDTVYNYNYADLNANLASYSLYRQNFYRTNFIYGFGRYEDVPEGINATIVGGITNKQGVKRNYYGLEGDVSNFNARKNYTVYTFRAGGYVNRKKFQDIDVLAGVNHISSLRSINSKWLTRNFVTVSVTRQFMPYLNTPLFLDSKYGLPYMHNGYNEADFRSTVNWETTFYNLDKFWGFGFAPFIFSDFSLLRPVKQSFSQAKGYSAIGAGFRTRNENLILGTIEVKGYYIPRITEGTKHFKIEATTNLRFRYNSSFIRRPDFVIAN